MFLRMPMDKDCTALRTAMARQRKEDSSFRKKLCDDEMICLLVVCFLFVAVQKGRFEGVLTGIHLATGPVDLYEIDLSMIFFTDV
jgi:hypothetical protein